MASNGLMEGLLPSVPDSVEQNDTQNGDNTEEGGPGHSSRGQHSQPAREARKTGDDKDKVQSDGVDARAEGEVGGAGLLDHVQLVGLPVPSCAKSPEIAACTHTPALKIDRSREVES
jgi:hypothetical protein